MKAVIVSVKPRFLPVEPESGFVLVKKADKDIYVRVFDDVIVYVYQCIGDESYRQIKKHNITSSFINEIKRDITERELLIPDEEFYLILHDGDMLIYGKGKNGIYSESARKSVKSKWDCNIHDGHILLFQHERHAEPYDSFITKLSNLDEEKVQITLKLFEK